MRTYGYYIIRPNATLVEALHVIEDQQLAALLAEPLLWKRPEDGITVWRRDDYIASIKLLFVLNVWWSYVKDNQESPVKPIVEQLLGAPPFTIETFDRWWAIERFGDIDEEYEAVIKQLRPEEFRLLYVTDLPLIEDWLEELQNPESSP